MKCMGILLLVTLSFSTACSGVGLDREALLQDTRLDKTVTLTSTGVVMGSLVEQLSAQAGVSLRPADPDEGAGDAPLVVRLSGLKLRDAMTSLTALLTYRGAPWYWTRRGPTGAWTYEIHQSREARAYPARRAAKVQSQFERLADALFAADQASESDRMKGAAALRSLLEGESDEVVAEMLTNERDRMGRLMLRQCMPPSQMAALLRGETRVQIPVAQLPRVGQDLVDRLVDEGHWERIKPDGTREPAGRPESATISSVLSPGEQSRWLHIQFSHMGGYSYCGGSPLERTAVRAARRDWITADDSETDARDGSDVPQAVLMRNLRRPFQDLLVALAEALDLQVVARRPLTSVRYGGGPVGKGLSGLWSSLEEPPARLAHKWRDGVLLFEFLPWYHEADAYPPWAAMRPLLALAAQPGGQPRIADLAPLGAVIPRDRLRLWRGLVPWCDAVESFHPLLAACASRKLLAAGLARKEGVPIDDTLRSVVSVWRPAGPGMPAPDLRRMRVRMGPIEYSNPPAEGLLVEAQIADGSWLVLSHADVSNPWPVRPGQ